MSMNFKFSRVYSQCQRVKASVVCCCSNSGSAEVLLEQQRKPSRSWVDMPHYTGGI